MYHSPINSDTVNISPRSWSAALSEPNPRLHLELASLVIKIEIYTGACRRISHSWYEPSDSWMRKRIENLEQVLFNQVRLISAKSEESTADRVVARRYGKPENDVSKLMKNLSVELLSAKASNENWIFSSYVSSVTKINAYLRELCFTISTRFYT